jgi:hypothetical protein
MAQTALELIYNWLLIEKEKIIVGKDAETISAANKIRLLLSRMKIPYEAPVGLNNLHAYIKKNTTKSEPLDAPEIVVQIRNAIVHSQIEKRRKLSVIPVVVKVEALRLCLWYIELSLLNILHYTGKYNNRCDGIMQDVPW